MVIQNYPKGYIGSGQPSPIPTSNVETATSSATSSESPSRNPAVDRLNEQIDRAKEKARRYDDKISSLKKRISSGNSDELTRRNYVKLVEAREELLRDIEQYKRQLKDARYDTPTTSISKPKYDAELVTTSRGKEVLNYGGVPQSEIQRRIGIYQAQEQAKTTRDVTYKDSGAVSKAYELQTEEEKQKTANTTANFKSSKDINYYRGGQDGKNTNNFQGFSGATQNSSSSSVRSIDPFQLRSYSRDTQYIPKSVNAQETYYTAGQGILNISKVREDASKVSLGQESISAYKKGGFGGVVFGTTLALISVGKGAGQAILGTFEFVSPYSIQKGEWQVPIYTPAKEFVKSIPEIPAYIKKEPFEFAGGVGGAVIGGKLFTGSIEGIKGAITKTGTPRTPESVFHQSYLEGKGLPKASSTQDSLTQFNTIQYEPSYPIKQSFARDSVNSNMPISQGSIPTNTALVVRQDPFIDLNRQPLQVSSASPKAIGSKGFYDELGEANPPKGTKGQAGLEDLGIYVTPRGKTSGAFLGLGESPEYAFSFNPFKNLLNRPTVTEIEVLSVDLQPRSVVSKPGFEATKQFFEAEGSKTGKAYITKRSEIGQGEIPRQEVVAKESGIFWGRKYVKGKSYPEPGTTELEAVLPYTSQFAIKNTFMDILRGGQEWTTTKGRVVAIKKGRLLGGEDNVKGYLENQNVGREVVVRPKLAEGEIVKSVSDISSGKANVEYVTPVSIVRTSTTAFPMSSSDVPDVVESSVIVSDDEPNSGAIVPSTPESEIDESSSSESSSTESSTPKIEIPSSPSTPSTPEYSIPESPIPITPNYSTSSTPDSSTPSIPLVPSTPSTPSIPSTPSKPPIITGGSFVTPPEFKGFSYPESKKRSSKAKLFVKKKGKFELRGESEDVNFLFNKGKTIVENTASASYKVVDDSNRPIVPKILGRKYSVSKKDSGVIVQKRGFRIGSLGEKSEITFKGIRANKMRRLM